MQSCSKMIELCMKGENKNIFSYLGVKNHEYLTSFKECDSSIF
ncbi:hypothetical protein DET59_108159 [Rossellomorea aquimaris]|uniref:Uncharacterized protein n=1 Tax=Rossellomorea aquimaris TaxID=189382 RepID=A0A366EMW0_9BACI|nr:hypothetical protein DET59_108159 [Rossellomorea aquimaris]